MLCGDRATSHDSCNDWNLCFLNYSGKNLVCVSDIYTAACEEQRLLGFLKHLEGFFELAHVNAGVWFVAADIYTLRIFCASKFSHDVLRKVDKNRSRTAGSCDIKSFFDDAAEVLTVTDGYAIFGDAAGDPYDVNFLESVVSDQMSGNLAGKTYERNAVIVGSCKSGDKVGSTRTAGYKTYADFAGSSCIGICFMDKCLFMARKDNVDPVLSV